MDCFLVIPCFHESCRVPAFLAELCSEIGASELTVGVVLVDDGSGEAELAKLRESISHLRKSYPDLGEVLALPENRGKGAAVRRGWQAAASAARMLAFIDADGSVPAREFLRLLRLALEQREEGLLLASRSASGSSVERSVFRKLLAVSFTVLIRVFYGVRIKDTQCGCKVVSARWYRRHAAEFREDGFGLDLELILKARETGCEVREVGIAWHAVPGSKVGVRGVLALAKAVALRRIGRGD